MLRVRLRNADQTSPARRPAIEPLEPRTLLSSSGTPALLVTVPGPLPAAAIAGSKINTQVKVDIANDGTGSSTGRTTVTLFASLDGTFDDSDAQLATSTRSLSIRAGSSKEVAVKIGTLPQNLNGDYFVIANVTAPTQTVQGVSTAAFAVSPAHVDLSNAITSIPPTAKLGNKVNVTLNVTNDGNETAKGTLAILFELSPFADGSNPVQVATLSERIDIKPAKPKVLHLHVPVALGSPSGNQFLVAILDPTDVFNDTNLANNTAISSTPVSFR